MKRRTEITIETERVVMLEGRHKDKTQWCEKCGDESHVIASDRAAALLGVNTGAILRWAEAAGLHFVEAADSPPLLCLNSISTR